MPSETLPVLIQNLFTEVEKLLPAYLQNKEDERIANGNWSAIDFKR